jgi:hypothetical protein
VTALLMTVGWATVASQTVAPTQDALRVLLESYERTDGPERLAVAYPALRGFPEAEQRRLLCDKLLADMIVGIPRGIWLGTLFTLAAFVAYGAYGATMAGDLLRLAGTRNGTLLRYLQATVPAALLVLLSYMHLFFPDPGQWRGPTVLLFVALTILAAAGVRQRWPGSLWLALYGTGLTLLLRLSVDWLPGYVDALVYVAALATAGWHFISRRPALTADSVHA